MRIVLGSALVLAACGDNGAKPGVDAAAIVDVSPDAFDSLYHCDSPPGTAALTVTTGAIGPRYARVFAGGISAGDGDTGATPNLELALLFTNDDLSVARHVQACMAHDATQCTANTLIVHALFAIADAVNTHDATIETVGGTLSVHGTLEITLYQDPFATSVEATGRVAGSLHVDSTTPAIALDGSFDHSFCGGLLGGVL